MYNNDIRELYRLVAVGTPVIVEDQAASPKLCVISVFYPKFRDLATI
jgi:hypothetical protein